MLFFPYRDEDTDILTKNFESFYFTNLAVIRENKEEFDRHGLENMMEEWHDQLEAEEEAQETDPVINEDYALHYTKDKTSSGQQKKSGPTVPERIILPPPMTNAEYLENTRHLNEQQQVCKHYFFNKISILNCRMIKVKLRR